MVCKFQLLLIQFLGFIFTIQSQAVRLTELDALLVQKCLQYIDVQDWIVLKNTNRVFCFQFKRKYPEFTLLMQLFHFAKIINKMNDSGTQIQSLINNTTKISKLYEKVRFSNLWKLTTMKFFQCFRWSKQKEHLLLLIMNIDINNLPSINNPPYINQISSPHQMLTHASELLLCCLLSSPPQILNIQCDIIKLLYTVSFNYLFKSRLLPISQTDHHQVILFPNLFLNSNWAHGTLESYIQQLKNNFQLKWVPDEIRVNFESQFIVKLLGGPRFDLKYMNQYPDNIFHCFIGMVMESLLTAPQLRVQIIIGLQQNNGFGLLSVQNIQTYLRMNITESNQFYNMLMNKIPIDKV
eukprot:88657_1